MRLKDFNYDLPAKLIAHEPVRPRDHSRLLVVDRKTGKMIHDRFYNLPEYLKPDDLLVFNNSKVFPARLFGRKKTGGRVEILLIRCDREGWEYISRPGIKAGTDLDFGLRVVAKVVSNRLNFNVSNAVLMEKLERIGHTPIPPYIHPGEHLAEPKLRQKYQTVYAAEIGSVAAPTAGFHFTKKLLAKFAKTFVTLHVGLGTFKPVKTDDIRDHQMHSEWYDISEKSISKITKAKRIIAVGTTSVRTLEAWANSGRTSGDTDIFIYPGYKFKTIDGLITNFHLPKSTLLMLVSAFAGRELIMHAYQEAIREKYRFYSFGDAMLIL